MKNLYLLIFLFYLPAGKILSQDYQALNSKSTYFFEGYPYTSVYLLINSIRIDSVAFSGIDSIFFPAKQFSYDYQYCLGASWTGTKVAIRPSGENVFYNETDSIVLITKASLNQTWKLFSFPNGDYLEATLTETCFPFFPILLPENCLLTQMKRLVAKFKLTFLVRREKFYKRKALNLPMRIQLIFPALQQEFIL